ncbi:MAG TPA: 50S ribosomal protein L7/L12 [Candidatus Azoamicus sp. MARI]
MSIKNEEIINSISKMTVLELVELIKEIEVKFNISSSVGSFKNEMPVDVVKELKVEEKTLFSVIMTEYGDDKINIIKKVRTILNLGLKEAKDFVEAIPALIKKDVSKIEADGIKKDLEASGAKIELK